MKDCNLGDYLMFDGALVKCVGVNDGQKAVILQPVNGKQCECCGSLGQITVIVSSPNFQNGAEQLKTITVKRTEEDEAGDWFWNKLTGEERLIILRHAVRPDFNDDMTITQDNVLNCYRAASGAPVPVWK